MALFPRREPFDRNREFRVRRPFVIAGHAYKLGDLFDKTLTTTRRLRLLYEQNFVSVIADGPPPPVPKVPNFAIMTRAELMSYLIGKNIIPRPSASQAKLLEMAKAHSE